MCHGLGSTPVESRNPRQGGHRDAGFPLLLPGLPPRLYIYGAISTFRRVRSALWPAGFPVYASVVPFPHPPASETAGFMLLTRCLPRLSHGLADTSATLGNDCWLGFIITGLSPDQKRLALLGAQQFYSPTGRNCPLFSDRSVNKEKPDRVVRNSGKIVHDRYASPSMMAIQGETGCGREARRETCCPRFTGSRGPERPLPHLGGARRRRYPKQGPRVTPGSLPGHSRLPPPRVSAADAGGSADWVRRGGGHSPDPYCRGRWGVRDQAGTKPEPGRLTPPCAAGRPARLG